MTDFALDMLTAILFVLLIPVVLVARVIEEIEDRRTMRVLLRELDHE